MIFEAYERTGSLRDPVALVRWPPTGAGHGVPEHDEADGMPVAMRRRPAREAAFAAKIAKSCQTDGAPDPDGCGARRTVRAEPSWRWREPRRRWVCVHAAAAAASPAHSPRIESPAWIDAIRPRSAAVDK